MAKRKRRRRKPATQHHTSSSTSPHTPVRGALTIDDSDTSPTLQLLVAMVKEIEKNQRLMALEIEALKTEQNPARIKMLEQAVKERDAASQGVEAAMAKVEQVAKQNPPSPMEVQARMKQAMEQAKDQHEKKKSAFLSELRNAKRVKVVCNKREGVPLTINGLTCWLNYGENIVPEPYAVLWDEIKGGDLEAEEMSLARQINYEDGRPIIPKFELLDDMISKSRTYAK